MGEIAEMMLDGTLCEGCGTAFGPDHVGPGHPVYCSPQCARDRGAEYFPPDGRTRKAKRRPVPSQPLRVGKTTSGKTHQCPACTRWLRGEVGFKAHMRDKHGVSTPRVNEKATP